jgi:proteasome alpha subunit
MSMPFYVSPEQLMKDRADYARKGIARGRSLVVLQYADGLLFASENTSPSLHKVSEIYDRLAFAAVGRYNEFENLRIAGVRLADMRGYSYDRSDVTGRGLANAYAQTLGAIFSSGGEKPYEVEIFVAEVGDTADGDQIYRLTYDGSVADVQGHAVMGGAVEPVQEYLGEHYSEGLDLAAALRLAVDALGHEATTTREVNIDRLEVAVLDRTRTQPRKFRRIDGRRLADLFASTASTSDRPADGVADSADSASTGEESDERSSTNGPAHRADSDSGTAGEADPADAIGDLPDDPDAPPGNA